MGLRLYREPDITKPDLIAAWPGIGNIGLIAIDTLRKAVEAEYFAEIEPWHFFYPKEIISGIRNDDFVSTKISASDCFVDGVICYILNFRFFNQAQIISIIKKPKQDLNHG